MCLGIRATIVGTPGDDVITGALTAATLSMASVATISSVVVAVMTLSVAVAVTIGSLVFTATIYSKVGPNTTAAMVVAVQISLIVHVNSRIVSLKSPLLLNKFGSLN